MAGVILLAMGLAQLGGVIKFIPNPVIVGFTSGIAVIIWVGQWKDFFGLHPGDSGTHFHEKVWALFEAFPALDVADHRHRPGDACDRGDGQSSARTRAGTAACARAAPCDAARHGTALSLRPAQRCHHRHRVRRHSALVAGASLAGPHACAGAQLVGPAFTIAMLGAIESLLTAVVADGMTGTRHDSNQELIGQGAANILAPLFGGFAATGAIARTATNIRNGATSPVAGIVHAVFLVMVMVVLAPFASAIPLAALSAILFFVAWNMSDLRHFSRLLKSAPRSDRLVLLITFGLTVFVDLVVAVNVGVVLAALLFMRRMAAHVNIKEEMLGDAANRAGTTDTVEGVTLPPSVLVYRIEGPFFFGAAEKLERTLERVQLHIETVVIRLGQVPFMDATGTQTLSEIIERFQRRRIRVILCGIQPRLRGGLERAEILKLVGEENICSNLIEVAQRIGGATPYTERSPV